MRLGFFISKLAITFHQLLNSMPLLCFKADLWKKWSYQYTNIDGLQGNVIRCPTENPDVKSTFNFKNLKRVLFLNWKHLFFNVEGIIPYDVLGTTFNSLIPFSMYLYQMQNFFKYVVEQYLWRSGLHYQVTQNSYKMKLTMLNGIHSFIASLYIPLCCA